MDTTSLTARTGAGERLREVLPALVLSGLSLAYYAAYIDAGFNFPDEGSFAQVVYELWLGASLKDLPISYGALWFKLGEGLFGLFGPDFIVLRLLFYGCILVTTLLVYAAISLITGSRWFAAGFAGVTALAPAFPPTAFYGLCVLINCVPQLRIARRMGDVRISDAALAGAALAISFQIRPDFGYIFTAPLVVLLVLAGFRGAPRAQGRQRLMLRLICAALAAFVVAHLPGVLLAIKDGYVAVLASQYLSFPAMLVDYGVRGVAALFGAGSSGASSLLQRPALFGAATAAELRLALLVYLPPLAMIAYIGWSLRAARRAADPFAFAAVAMVVITTAVATFPHYFFYRPDLSHIANFVPGLAVLAGVFTWQVLAGSRRAALLAGPGLAVLVLYLWVGLSQEGSGSIAGTFQRTERFVAANGVDVRLNPGEKALLDELKSVIEANSAPGDAIICVPYCPGIAFMTGRRLFFSEHYVDDTLPARDPQWIARAVERTRGQRPPVVIVMDWAINGTDISRFSRWASPYMEALESLAREKMERPGVSIYLL